MTRRFASGRYSPQIPAIAAIWAFAAPGTAGNPWQLVVAPGRVRQQGFTVTISGMSDHLMPLVELASLLGVSESTARRMTKEAGFPARYCLAGRIVRWRRSEVEKWLAGRAEVPSVVPAVISEDLLTSQPRGPRRRRRGPGRKAA